MITSTIIPADGGFMACANEFRGLDMNGNMSPPETSKLTAKGATQEEAWANLRQMCKVHGGYDLEPLKATV